jgi:Glucodextranase, domain B
MKKKIIVAVTVFGLLAVLLVSCTKSASTPSATTEGTLTSENNSITTATTSSGVSTTLANNSTVTSPLGTTSGTLQSGLPLSVTEPTDSTTINGDTVNVQGTTTPGATVSVNDNVVTADSTGAFSTNVSLDAGPNAIDVIATDDNNNQGEVLLMVNAMPTTSTATSALGASQGTLPLAVTSPIDSATLSTSTVTVQGRTTPGATVTVNGNSDVADANGNFSIGVSLDNGPNAIDVIATDDSGNLGEVLLMVNNTSGS